MRPSERSECVDWVVMYVAKTAFHMVFHHYRHPFLYLGSFLRKILLLHKMSFDCNVVYHRNEMKNGLLELEFLA